MLTKLKKTVVSFFASYCAASVVLVLAYVVQVSRFNVSSSDSGQFVMMIAIFAALFAVPATISNWLNLHRWLSSIVIATVLCLVFLKSVKVSPPVDFTVSDYFEIFCNLMVPILPAAITASFAPSWFSSTVSSLKRLFDFSQLNDLT